MYQTLSQFYTSAEWKRTRAEAIARTMNSRGFAVDEITGEEIIKACDVVVHHVIELTIENVNDFSVSLNLANLKVVSFKTHNEIHKRFSSAQRKVYWVWGSPFAGKLEFVKRSMALGDLILDTNSIWDALDGSLGYVKPKSLNAVVFAIRNGVLDCVMTRNGQWRNAWVINSCYDKGLIARLDAEPILIRSSFEDCMRKAQEVSQEQTVFVQRWWDAYGNVPPLGT